MRQHDKPLNFAERVKAHSPLWFEFAKRQGMTPEQYQTIEDKQEQAWRKRQRTSELPFPLPDIYKEDGDWRLPRDALEAVGAYRVLLQRFGPDRDEDEDQPKKATDVALGIRLAWSIEYDLELAEVPMANDPKHPTDENFARLEQWFLTTTNATKKEIARLSSTQPAGATPQANPKKQSSPDDRDPFYKPVYFKQSNIGDELLRRNATDLKEYTEGKVRRQRKQPSSTTRKSPAKGKRGKGKGRARPVYWYSEPDGRKRWLHLFAETKESLPKS